MIGLDIVKVLISEIYILSFIQYFQIVEWQGFRLLAREIVGYPAVVTSLKLSDQSGDITLPGHPALQLTPGWWERSRRPAARPRGFPCRGR